jgi:uncharacterized protein (DUF779 family)
MSYITFTASDRARTLLEDLRKRHGALVLHQSPIYCDGFTPVCLPKTDFVQCANDVLLGRIGEVPYYGSGALAQYWRGMSIELDTNPGTPSPVSLESGTGLRLVLNAHRRPRQPSSADLPTRLAA